MELIPLGTSSASIVRDRGLSAFVLQSGSNYFLFDCGDGTQFRLLRAGIRLSRIRSVFISHMHGDHYFGLLGLLVSMSLRGRDHPLTIIAPSQLSDLLDKIPGIRSGDLNFPIDHVSLDESSESKEVYQGYGLYVRTYSLHHGRLCFGYRVEKREQRNKIDSQLARSHGIETQSQFKRLAGGASVRIATGEMISLDQVKKKSVVIFAYVPDTSPCRGGIDLAENADLMVHEATFLEKDSDRAVATGHSTASGAAQVAKAAGAKKLLLTHISPRYPDQDLLEKEAKTIFPKSEIAREFRVYPIDSKLHQEHSGDS